ncbi:MAG: DNA ligase D [Rubritepida sp.]|nr:DNA ligase D [Rubritepida sp.]
MGASADKLGTYRAKRDFSRSPEPAGVVAAPGKTLSFCVQKHDATRLHYDFRLEWGGVLKSWAVTRGPSLDPADKRLAVEVEDHPLDYGDFEGVIPEGYGAGVVQLWDRGSWAPLHPEAVEQDLDRGELKFVVAGARIRGGYVLIRLKPRAGEKPGRHNWLLIKERDSMATPGAGDAVLGDETSVKTGRTMAQIGAKPGRGEVWPPPGRGEGAVGPRAERAKAARPAAKRAAAKAGPSPTGREPDEAGQGTAGAQPAAAKPVGRKPAKPRAVASQVAAAPSARHRPAIAMPDFVPPQLCRLVTAPPAGDAWLHELKLDGYRTQLRVAGGQAAIRTRTGLDWTPRFAALARAAAALPDGLADGEVVVLDDKGQPSFSELQAVLAGDSRAPMVFYLFDLLFAGAVDLRPRPLTERKAALKLWLDGAAPALRYLDDFRAPGEAVLASACELAMEGIVSKRADASYISGRNDGWTKAKCRGRDEFVIGGYTPEKTGRGLGALLMGAMRDGRLIHLGRVGTGFSAKVADGLLQRLEPLVQPVSPFSGAQPPRAGAVKWVRPKLVAEIAYGGWTGEGMLRHASFQGLREDKRAADVTPPPEPVPPPGPAPAGPRPAAKARPGPAVARPAGTSPPPALTPARPIPALRLTHPEKQLWPATDDSPAITKADLAAYYQSHAEAILASCGGRPLSVVRAPDGIGGQLFFQRHAMPGQSPLIGAVEMPGQRRAFLRVDDMPGLLAMAQMSVLELHPSGARADDPTRPDRLVFDLDPAEGLDFDAVIAGGLELKRRLEALGLTTFPRITGGKGLHLVVPLARGDLGWPEGKKFAQLVCVQLEQDMPERFTTNMAKKLRTGRIFLDYLRNDLLSTAIASWSPRARPGAPVARPVAWPEVKAGLVPNGTRLAAVRDTPPPARDPWAGFSDAGGSLAGAIRALTSRSVA